MFVGSLLFELQIPGARSLKDKRQVLAALLGRLRARYPVSVAEVGGQDSWQRAEIAVAAVSGDSGRLGRLLEQVRQHVEADAEMVVCGVQSQVYS